MDYTLQPAIARDIKGIHSLLLAAAGTGQLLPRSLQNLYSHARDFQIVKDASGAVVGCCALPIVWEDLAEVRTLYLVDALRGRGLGRALVEACLESARAMGVGKVFTLTYKTEFFARLGFAEVDKEVLPQKIWADCIHCPKFPDDCDEVAMQRAV